MSLPLFYTDDTLAAFMRGELKNLTADLGWQNEPFTEEINDLVLDMGVQGVEQVADIALLRAKARIVAWKAAEKATTGDYDTSSSQDADKRSQVHTNATRQRQSAEATLKALLDARAVGDELEAVQAEADMLTSRSGRIVASW